MILYRLMGESIDLWFPTDAEARAKGEALFRQTPCTVHRVRLPASKAKMAEFLNFIGGCI